MGEQGLLTWSRGREPAEWVSSCHTLDGITWLCPGLGPPPALPAWSVIHARGAQGAGKDVPAWTTDYLGHICFTVDMQLLLLVATTKCLLSLILSGFKQILWASLVAQWLRICLPMQGTRVRALVWEDPTCRRATKPVSHNY